MSTSNCYNYFFNKPVGGAISYFMFCGHINGLFILSNEDPVLVALGRLKRFYRVKIKI